MTESTAFAPTTEADDPERELQKMSFLEHLEELRKRLLFSFIAIAAGFAVCWRYADLIFTWMEQPLAKFLPPGDKLAFTRHSDSEEIGRLTAANTERLFGLALEAAL